MQTVNPPHSHAETQNLLGRRVSSATATTVALPEPQLPAAPSVWSQIGSVAGNAIAAPKLRMACLACATYGLSTGATPLALVSGGLFVAGNISKYYQIHTSTAPRIVRQAECAFEAVLLSIGIGICRYFYTLPDSANEPVDMSA